jgi:integrase
MMETSKHRYCNDLSSLNASMRRRCFPAGGLRAATVEDVRDALARITAGVAETTGRQYVLRVKSLLGYAHPLGYAPFNAGATIRVRSDARNRGATLTKRIISEVDVALLVRGGRTKRNRVLLEVLYAGGLRVSEVASLAWADVLMRDKGPSAARYWPCAATPAPTTRCSPAARRAPSWASGQFCASSSAPPRAPASRRPYHRTGCATRREPRHRPRRHAARGAVDARARQHRDDVRLFARAPRIIERVEAGSWSVSSMKERRPTNAILLHGYFGLTGGEHGTCYP